MKNYLKAVDQGKELEDQRQYAPALEKYTKALGLFDPPLLLPPLRIGLCRCHLRARKGVQAVEACKVAHEADSDDLEVIFLFADARVLNEEDHAALQLLKIAQRRHQRNGQLHQKVRQLLPSYHPLQQLHQKVRQLLPSYHPYSSCTRRCGSSSINPSPTPTPNPIPPYP